MELIPVARAVSDGATSGAASNSTETLRASVGAAIITAAGNGLRTASVSISGKSGSDVLNILKSLRTLQYTYTISGTTLTVAWS